MRKKLKDRSGFTMVEMLCVVVIMVMLCLLANAALSLAMRSYRDIIAESETKLLLNDLTDALGDKLRYAVVTKKHDADGNEKMEPSVQTYIVDGVIKVNNRTLLSVGAYGSKQPDGGRRYVVETADVETDCTGETPVFKVTLKVKDRLGGVSGKTDFIIRCLNPVKEEVEYP